MCHALECKSKLVISRQWIVIDVCFYGFIILEFKEVHSEVCCDISK